MPHKVALFVTCLTDQYYPHVGVAVTKILERFDCQVEFPPDQTCCGQPFFNNGFQKEAGDLAKRWIKTFEPYDYIVTPSGSCAAMVREQYHEMFHHDPAWGPGMEKVRGKTFEFVEFLVKVLKVDLSGLSLPEPQSFTFHYTCHGRGLGLKDEPVQILNKIDNTSFVPMEKAEQCCGFGGTFAIKYPAISEAIVDDKIKCIAATNTQTTICNDAGCSMNISGMCHRHGVKTNVKHIAEVLAEAMAIDVGTL
ncbi:MAG: (Fe-S)-binding protein [Burkholderiales bacterium]|nr:(Fe-S)-binding protein [Phycisphaerae bacterium]